MYSNRIQELQNLVQNNMSNGTGPKSYSKKATKKITTGKEVKRNKISSYHRRIEHT